MEPLKKDFITCDMIRSGALGCAYVMYTVGVFVSDVIYDSRRCGAYVVNVIGE